MKSWDGKLTQKVRDDLREKRHRLGASRKALGNLLGVSESTVQKWEGGKVEAVNIGFRPQIMAFLNGEFDGHFQQWRKKGAAAASAVADGSAGAAKTAPPALRAVFDEVAAVYKALQTAPDAQAELLKKLEDAAGEVMGRLAAAGKPPRK